MHMSHRELRLRAEAYNLRVWDGVRNRRSDADGMCVSGRGSGILESILSWPKACHEAG